MPLQAKTETIEERAGRYERTLRAIRNCTLTGVDFGDWVQATCDDALDGLEPECYNCETFVHDGPCVAETAPEEADGNS